MVEVVSKLGSFMQLHSLLHRRYPYPYPDLELGWIGDQPLSGVACRSLRPSDLLRRPARAYFTTSHLAARPEPDGNGDSTAGNSGLMPASVRICRNVGSAFSVLACYA
jgi:hypothetical protein